MTDIIKIVSNVSVLNENLASPIVKLLDQVSLLQPSTYYNGKKTLLVDSANSLIGDDCNTVVLYSINGHPFSISINESSEIMTNLYIYSFCSDDNFSFEAYNESVENEAEIMFFIGSTSVLDSSYVYS